MEELIKFFNEKKEIEYKKAQTILEEGSKIDYIYLLVKGNVYISRHLKDGKRIIANNLEAPQILSLIEVLNSEKTVMGSVIAINDVKVLKINKEEFVGYLKIEEFKNMILSYLAKFSFNIIKNDMEYEKYDVEKSILKYFLNMSKNPESEKTQPSNAFLADMFRISERTLYRYLSSWEARGLIQRNKGLVYISKENKMKIQKFLGE